MREEQLLNIWISQFVLTYIHYFVTFTCIHGEEEFAGKGSSSSSFSFLLSVLHFLWVGRASLFCRIVMLLVFLSALTFTGPEKYLILVLVN